MTDPPTSYSFTVPGDPVPKQRHRTAGGHTYTPARTKAWEAWVGLCYKGPKFEGPVSLVCVFYRATLRRCDIDNLMKALCDGLNKKAWDDDWQVVHSCQTRLLDRERPRVEVTISEWKGDDDGN